MAFSIGDMNDSMRKAGRRLIDAANEKWLVEPSKLAIENRLDAVRAARLALQEIIDNAPMPGQE